MTKSRSFYEEISRNKRNSIFIVFLVAMLWVALGLGIGAAYGQPWIGLAIAGAFSTIQVFVILGGGAKVALLAAGAKKVDHEQAPRLYNVVEEMKIASGLPMPGVYIIDSPAMNAFATGLSPENSAIAVTRGLLEKLTREELQGVIAHEMSHIRNYDIRISIVLAVMVGSIVMISDLFLRWTFWSSMGSRRRSSNKDGGNVVFLVIAIALAILAPLFAMMLQFAVSRKREYLADASAVELTRYPQGLANALKKLSDPSSKPLEGTGKAFAHLYIANPLRKKSKVRKKSGVFDTHPPIDERIKRLEQMAHIYEENQEDDSEQESTVSSSESKE